MNIGRGVVRQYLQGLSGLMAGRESTVRNSILLLSLWFFYFFAG